MHVQACTRQHIHSKQTRSKLVISVGGLPSPLISSSIGGPRVTKSADGVGGVELGLEGNEEGAR